MNKTQRIYGVSWKVHTHIYLFIIKNLKKKSNINTIKSRLHIENIFFHFVNFYKLIFIFKCSLATPLSCGNHHLVHNSNNFFYRNLNQHQ